MSEESKQADTLSWDEHLRLGVKGLKGEINETLKSRETVESVRKNGRAAMKEMLLAWRSLLDGAIAHMDESAKEGPKRPTKINIE